MNIGQAAAASGISAKMIRHYEAIGLGGKARRSPSGYRVYSDADVHVLRFIRRARSLGFSTKEIAKLLALWRSRRSGSEVKRMALAHVDGLERRIADMREMARTLKHLAAHCRGDDRPDCPILGELEKPSGRITALRAAEQVPMGSAPSALR